MCEYGKPWSRAKAHVSLDAEANTLKSATEITIAIATIKTLVAATELVAW